MTNLNIRKQFNEIERKMIDSYVEESGRICESFYGENEDKEKFFNEFMDEFLRSILNIEDNLTDFLLHIAVKLSNKKNAHEIVELCKKDLLRNYITILDSIKVEKLLG